MKKYIIISGVPRAGKSKLSQKIAKEFGCQHISMDSILAGIEMVFPETGINTDADCAPEKNLEFISSKAAPFIRAMIDSGEYDECDYGIVIDVYQLLPKDFVRYIGREKADIIYLLSSDVSTEERYKILKEHDTENDYSYYRTEKENLTDCEDIVRLSKLIKAQCIEYNLPFYETSRDREDVLIGILENIMK